MLPEPMRLTTIRPGAEPLSNERPPYQTFPSRSAANIGSQQMSPLSFDAEPGLSIVCGMVRWVQV